MRSTHQTNCRSKAVATTVILAASLLVAGCETNPLAEFDKAWNKDAVGTVTPITAQTMQIKVPKDSGIRAHHPQIGAFMVARDLGYTDRHQFHARAAYTRLLYESPTGNSFKIHGRYDNGAAGSGIRYEIRYTVVDRPSEYVVSLTPVSQEIYQQGMGSKLAVPDFRVEDVYGHLASVDIAYSFEIDSPYSTDAVTANFMRSRAVQRINGGYRDPVTGKIISTAYRIPLADGSGGPAVSFNLDVYPYRNGSKAVINAIIPGVQTSPGVVDFKVLIDQVKTTAAGIIKS